jgi:hypothetical protein
MGGLFGLGKKGRGEEEGNEGKETFHGLNELGRSGDG